MGAIIEKASDAGVRMSPGDFKGIYLTDALLYSILLNPSRSKAVITIEADPQYHKRFFDFIGLSGDAPILIEIVAFKVSKVTAEGIAERPSMWKEDEKPHNCEIASFSIRRRKFFFRGVCLQIRTQEGLQYVFHCEEVLARRGSNQPGVIHGYQ